MKSKQELRDEWKSQYPRDEGEQKRRHRPVQELLLQSEIFQQAPTVGIYAALPWEIDLTPLWKRRPQACVFPRTLPITRDLEFYRIAELSDLKPGHGTILEPNSPIGFKVTTWERGSLIIIPGAAFNKEGGRIGTGKGYYDRFLAQIPTHVQRWGVCYSEQLKEEAFPLEPTDVRMHAVITDEGFFSIDV